MNLLRARLSHTTPRRHAVLLTLLGVALMVLSSSAQTGAPTSSQNQGTRPIGPNTQPPAGTPGVTLFAYGSTAGDTAVPPSDDGSTDIGAALRGIGPEGSSAVMNFGGTTYHNVYANVNGLVSFGSTLENYIPQAFPNPTPVPMLAPYWADADIRYGTPTLPSGNVWYRTTTDADQLAAITGRIESAYASTQNFTPTFAQIVTWDKVGRFNNSNSTDNTKVNTFQAIIASNGLETYTIYLYPKDGIWWELGSASQGQLPSVGYYANTDNYANVPGSGTTAMRDLWFATNTADGQKGTFIFDVGGDLSAITVNGTYTATGTAAPELRFAANSAGHTVTADTAADSLIFGRLRFDDPANRATFTNQIVALAAQADAIVEGNLAFEGNSVLVAQATGALNGGALTLRDNAKLALYAPDASTAATTLTFDNTAGGGNGGTLDLRGFNTAVGAVNSVGSAAGLITNSGATAATLTFGGAGTGNFKGSLQDGPAVLHVAKTGTGTQRLSGANSYTGTTTVSGGMLQFAQAGSFYAGDVTAATAAKLTVQSGAFATFNVGGAGEFTGAQLSTLIEHANLTGGGLGIDTTNVSGGAFTLSHPLSGDQGFAKLGSGTLTLAGANSYTGATLLHGGGLAFTYSPTLYNFSGAGGTLLTGSGQTVTLHQTADRTFSGTTAGAGALVKTGPGALTLTGASTHTGGTTISAGALQIGDGGTSGSLAGDVINQGSLVFNRSDVATFSGALSGDGSVVQRGAGTLTLSGANTYTGGTTISGGTLSIGSDANLGASASSLTLDGGTLVTSASLTSARAASLTAEGGTFAPSPGTSLTWSGVIDGTGPLQKAERGMLVLTNANNYSGGTFISAGTLQLGNGGTSGSLAGDVSLGSSGTLAFNRSDATTFAHAISGAGGLMQAGPGKLALTGANTYTGDTTVAIGSTLQFGTVASFYGGIVNSTNTQKLNLQTGSTLIFSAGGTGEFNSAQLATVLNRGGYASDRIIGIDTTHATGGTFDFSNSTFTLGSLAKFGTGTLALMASLSSVQSGFTVAEGTVRVTSTGSLDGFDLIVAGGANFTIQRDSASLRSISGAGAIHLDPTALTVGGSDADTTFSGVISGTGSLTKTGTGTLTLSGANTYTGATTIAVGTLRLSGSDRLADTSALTVASGATFDLAGFSDTLGALAGAGQVTLGSGSLTAGGNNTSTPFSGTLSGSGAFTKSGTGTLTFTGANTHTGGTAISGGTLQIGDGGATGSLAGNIVNNATLDFNRSDDFTFAGLISGTGSLTKLGAGTLTLTGNHTYTGGTSISAGTLVLGDGGTSGSLAGNIVNHGALVLYRADNLSLANAISGTGSLTKLGTNTLTITGSNTSTGTTTIAAGTLQIGDGGTTGSLAGNIVNHGALAIHRSDNVSLAGVISGSGTLTKLGTNTLTLTGANTYTGATTISAGTLALGAANRIADTSALVVALGATFHLANFSDTLGSLSGAGNVSLGSGTVTAGGDNSSTTFSGIISGPGGFTKSGTGTLTLSGASTYAGPTTLAGGITRISANANLGAANGAVTFNGGTLATTASLTAARTTTVNSGGGMFDTAADTTLTWNGNISGLGGLTKTGDGSLTLGGGTLSFGSLHVTAGSVSVSSSGTLSTGAVTVEAGAALDLVKANLGSLSGAGYIGFYGSSVIGLDNSSSTFSGGFGNAGTLTKRGTGTLTLSGSAGPYLPTGTLNLEAGTVRLDSSAVLSRNYLTLSGGALEFGSVTSASLFGLSGNGSLNLTNHDGLGVALTVGSPGENASSAYSGALSGSGSLIVANGFTQLSGANSHTGGTTIAYASWLTLSGSGTLGAAANTLTFTGTGGTLALNGTSQSIGHLSGTAGVIINGGATDSTLTLGHGNADGGVFSGMIADRITGAATGKLALVKTGSGTLILSGANTHTGGTTISGGTLQIGTGGTTGSLAGDIVNNATLAFNRTNDLTFAGLISGTGTLTKLGAGTLTLTGNHTFTGATTISAGALQIGDGGATGALTGNAALAAGTALTFNRADDSAYAGVISGSGSFTKTGSGALTFSGNHTYTGGTTIDAGTLVAARVGEKGTFATGSTVTVNAAGTLVVSGDSLGWGNGAAKLVVNGGTVSSASTTGVHTTLRDLTLTGGLLTTSGTGRFLLNGPLVTHASHTTATIATRLELLANATNPTAFTVAAGTTANGIDLALTGNVHGSGALVKNGAGTLLLTGSATHTGGTTINTGTLQIGDGGTSGSLSGNLTNHAALIFNRADATTFSGVISGSGSLVKTGTGTLTLAATNSLTGATNVSAGTLRINGSLASSATTIHSGATLTGAGTVGSLTLAAGATLTPGNSPGTLTVNGNATWHGGANYEWEITDSADPTAPGAAGTNYDLLSISGTLTINATRENKFTLSLVSLLANNSPGDALNFNATQNYTYIIASATGGIFGFDADAFMIDASGFTNALNGGAWNLSLGNSNRDLTLNFTAAAAPIPEPSTYAAFFGALALGFVVYRKRKANP